MTWTPDADERASLASLAPRHITQKAQVARMLDNYDKAAALTEFAERDADERTPELVAALSDADADANANANANADSGSGVGGTDGGETDASSDADGITVEAAEDGPDYDDDRNKPWMPSSAQVNGGDN